MTIGIFHDQSLLGTISDRSGPDDAPRGGKWLSVVLLSAVAGIAPLAYGLASLAGSDWLGSVIGAAAISAVLAVNAFMLIGT